MTDYEDMEITCADCKKPFIFEAGEHQYWNEDYEALCGYMMNE